MVMTPRILMRSLAFAFILMFFGTSAGLAGETGITIHFHERLPYYAATADGVGGIIGDRVTAVMKAAGIHCTYKETPPKRQLALIRANAGKRCIIGWFKNPEREAFAQFSAPIYRDKPQVAVVRSYSPLAGTRMDIEKLLTMKDKKLLIKSGYSYGAQLDELIGRHRPETVVTGTDDVKVLKMIRGRRGDYLFIAPEELGHLLGLPGLSKEDYGMVNLDGVPPGNHRYLLFTRQVPPETIQTINNAIEQLYPGS